jgi:hypothetical protein
MGVCDDDVETLLNTVPKTQCKKLAGNSICVNVMSEIFKKLFCQKSNNPETSLF